MPAALLVLAWPPLPAGACPKRARFGQTVAMASGNPAMNDNIFEREARAAGTGGFDPAWGSPASEVPPGLFGGGRGTMPPPTGTPVREVDHGDTMRLSGSLSAAAILLAILVVAGWFGWQAVTVVTTEDLAGNTRVVSQDIPGWLIGSLIGGLGLAILTIFKPKLARFTGPLYALAEGLFVGAISKLYEAQYDGIVLQAVGLTIGVFVVMLVLYATGTVKVTDKLRTGIIAATGAVALVYLVSIVLRFFGSGVPMIHDAGPVGIGFSLVVVAIASFNLLLDFDFMERGVQMGAPRYMEWYAGFGLILTLVWLYLELLRLLSKLRSR